MCDNVGWSDRFGIAGFEGESGHQPRKVNSLQRLENTVHSSLEPLERNAALTASLS